MIPWLLVSLIGAVACRLGYDVNVLAQGGPGWHRGRVGADRLYFVRRPTGAPRPTMLRRA